MYKDKTVTLVVATDLLDTIGIDNELPWRCKADLQHFRQLTTGKVCIMGRKTFESLPAPLKKRKVVVISANPSEALIDQIFDLEDHCIVPDVETALGLASALSKEGDSLMVCGGASIYKEFIPYVDRAEISKINTVVQEVEGKKLVKFDVTIPKEVIVNYTFFNLEGTNDH